jgi:hypothetical protein
MRGIYLYNFPTFDAAADMLRRLGYAPVNPAELDRACGFDPTRLPKDWDWKALPPGFDFKGCRKRDVDALESSRSIYMLRGWASSTGATAEHSHAKWMGIKIYEEGDVVPEFNR